MNFRVYKVSTLLAIGFSRQELISAFVDINLRTWGSAVNEKYIWTPQKVEQHFTRCPELQFCAMAENKVLGTASTMHIAESRMDSCRNWEEISDFGTLTTHDPTGDYAFGADLSVPEEYQGHGVGEALVDAGLFCSVILSNKKGLFLGSRIPRYFRRSTMNIEDYVFGKKRDFRTHDPEIRLYQKCGFRPIKILPGYMEDPESLNNGVLMVWRNPFHETHVSGSDATKIAKMAEGML